MAQALCDTLSDEFAPAGDALAGASAPACGQAVEQWLRQQAAPALAALREDPARGLSSAEVLGRIAQEHAKQK